MRFYHTVVNNEKYIELSFISWSGWKSKIETLSAKQFLQQEDSAKLGESIEKLSEIMKEFELFIQTCKDTILEEAEVNVLDLNDTLKLNEEGDLERFSEIAARALTYVIFDLNSNWGIPEAQYKLREYFKKDVLKFLNKKPSFRNKKREMKRFRKEVLETATHLLEKAETMRHELCLRYNTIYSDAPESYSSFIENSQLFS